MEILFNVAGLALVLHLACSTLMLAFLRDDALAQVLFAIPGGWPGARPRWFALRLLRGRFLVPWTPAPAGLTRESTLVNLAFWSARIAGTVFPLAALAFLFLAISAAGAYA